MLTGMGVVLSENSLGIPVGDVVRLGQVDLMFKIDISETNAGPRWIPNPNSQFVAFQGDFNEKPFCLYVFDYQIISSINGYQGADLEDTLSNFKAQ